MDTTDVIALTADEVAQPDVDGLRQRGVPTDMVTWLHEHPQAGAVRLHLPMLIIELLDTKEGD